MIILRNKFFSDGSDRNSEWWKRKIAEERKRNPNSPRIKKWESVLQYTLEKEGKADPKKAQEAASRAAQGHSAYSGKQKSSGRGSSSSQWGSSDDFFKNWWGDCKKNYEERQRKENWWEGRREQYEKDKKEWEERSRQRKAQEGADIKGYRNESSKIREDIRRKFNKKNYTGNSLKNFRRGVTIMAGVAVPVAAYSAYRSKKSRDKWKETQKFYSSKTKSDKYYQGEETKSQKWNRERSYRNIVGSGVSLGGGLGAILAESKVSDAANRVNKSYRAEKLAKNALYDRLDNGKKFNVISEHIRDTTNDIQANMNYNRRMGKLGEKAIIRGALKGAAVGGTIGGLAAYAYNNTAKTRNEKANVKKRKK